MGDKTLLGSLNHVKILSNFVDPCKTTVLHTIRKVSLHFDGISTREYVVIIPSDASQFFHSLTHTYTPASIPSPSPPRSSHGPSPSIPKICLITSYRRHVRMFRRPWPLNRTNGATISSAIATQGRIFAHIAGDVGPRVSPSSTARQSRFETLRQLPPPPLYSLST